MSEKTRANMQRRREALRILLEPAPPKRPTSKRTPKAVEPEPVEEAVEAAAEEAKEQDGAEGEA